MSDFSLLEHSLLNLLFLLLFLVKRVNLPFMLYMIQNNKGEIVGLATEPAKNAVPADLKDPEVINFLKYQGLTPESLTEVGLQRTDIPLIRVIEDLVDVLVSKGVLNLTDLPTSAIQKLSLRSRLREERKSLRDLVDDHGEEIPL